MSRFDQGQALVVGVGGDLPGTVDDAKALADILTMPDHCAYPPSQVRRLTGPTATRQTVLAGLDELAKAGKEAVVLVYFSGHGYLVTSSMGTIYFLLPYGYDLTNLAKTCISGVEFTEKLHAISARRLLVLLDCCHAGSMGEPKSPGLTFAKVPLPSEAEAILGEGRGRVIIASCREGELSYGSTPHSAFTIALLESLSGQGVGIQDGYVNVSDLVLHVQEVIPQRTSGRQHPTIRFCQSDDFAVAYYAGGSKEPRPLTFPLASETVGIPESPARPDLHAYLDWIDAGAQERALGALAWTLQEQGEGTSLPTGKALGAIPSRVMVRGREVQTNPQTVLRLGCAATLLEETLEGQVRFYHHLIQEYFAARELLRRFDSGEDLQTLWKAPWWVREMPEPAGRGEWDPLPPPPSTGWEETTIMAASLAEDPAVLLEAVRVANPILAGRCLDEGGIDIPDDLRERVRADLLSGMQDRRVHLRARIAAGHILGRLGDPRFAIRERDSVCYAEPPLVRVSGGVYTIGSPWWDRQTYDDERPRHRAQLAESWIGQYPVTVAEYRCFVAAGGYGDERYWTEEPARAWLRGDGAEGEALESLLEIRQWLLDSDHPLEHWAKEWNWMPQTLETWRTLATMTEKKAREALHPIYAERSRQEPAWWDYAALTGANQPVVGVTWYEARAYCTWLAGVVNRPCRLPTEAEWEAAVRGGEGRIYPWGNRFDAVRVNTVEGQVLVTTPVGVYPQGLGPLGLWDGAGNVWEWTSSLYQPYPYRMDDGRDDPAASGQRVLRGGSWNSNHKVARSTFRDAAPPDNFSDSIGFRVVLPGPLSPDS
ncbi:MAG: SUMF1/EgtB/PvdO family nonheme iron enzyme [Chloroflexota bacterium]|nr:SUMF1/EgtB/PvdO family nonheme iron enzyme [Chloroflexota bacterium]